jgi:hypothetical protein
MKNKDDILKYFPDYHENVYPFRQYLMDVLNTLDPGLVIKTIKDLKKKKLKKEAEEHPVLVSTKFMNKLKVFESISLDPHIVGIGNIV